jgi:CheY-like chemotaxis protein
VAGTALLPESPSARTSSLVRAEQRERRRLSETMHDDLQQVLYGVHLKLKLGRDALARGASGETAEHLTQAEALLARATRVTRQLSVDLNPPILKNEGLRAILEWLKNQMRELHGLEVEIRADGEVRIDDGDVRVYPSAETALAGIEGDGGLPDLILIDLSLPGMSGIDLIRRLHALHPELRCAILSGHRSPTYVGQALAAGAMGYILKGDPLEISRGIDAIVRGGRFVSADLTEAQ